jgi:hypothetical protein
VIKRRQQQIAVAVNVKHGFGRVVGCDGVSVARFYRNLLEERTQAFRSSRQFLFKLHMVNTEGDDPMKKRRKVIKIILFPGQKVLVEARKKKRRRLSL